MAAWDNTLTTVQDPMLILQIVGFFLFAGFIAYGAYWILTNYGN